VTLVDVDETVLADMVDAAVHDADPDEVTPPIDDGGEWTDARLDSLRDLHRSCRAGLAGPIGQATWAVCQDGRVVGAVRLKRTKDNGVLETGIWLCRSARGSGTALSALRALVGKAVDHGAKAIYAETTLNNVRAQGVLRQLGFALSSGPRPDEVRALLRLR
jgi:RimJ/RimL family protein N-acetyltransferase